MVYTACMKYVFVGLGNSGEEYEGTRHNAGRSAVQFLVREQVTSGSDWKDDKKLRALTFSQKEKKNELLFVLPETMMNNSGKAVAPLVKTKKDLERLVVFYDDVDLPVGTFKLSFNRGSGGHKGLESVMRATKSREFYRVRIGICPTTPGGKLKKPDQKKFLDFILKEFTDAEHKELKKVFKKIKEAVGVFVTDGPSFAMNVANTQ